MTFHKHFPLNGPLEGRVLLNLNESQLFEEAVRRKEGLVSENGAFVVETGANTGRSAQDKFILLDEATKDSVWWQKNTPMSREHFEALFEDVSAFMAKDKKDIFVQDLFACAEKKYHTRIRVVTQYAWHSLFMRHLLIVPKDEEREADSKAFEADFLIIDMPEFKADPARHGARTGTMIACDFTRKIVIIVGTAYAGEMKKSVFTLLNFVLPEKNVMPMHCSVNVGQQGDACIFFALCGTRKTTLSADPNRVLIGDDEHGWCETGLFNFEGGCYAKMIRISAEYEPEIYATAQRFGTVLENVVINPKTRQLDFDDDTLTENTRAAYPISYIPNASLKGVGPHPKNIVLLTADAFGVMPPVALLNEEQAIYHFLSGYTARIAGTEKGLKEPEAVFSACFGAPFMARHPYSYGKILRSYIQKYGVSCWLLNTGWTGGPYGVGQRISISDTRLILRHILDGSLLNETMYQDPVFHFLVPEHIEGLTNMKILHPRNTWKVPSDCDSMRQKVAALFKENFEELHLCDDPKILQAGPRVDRCMSV